MYELFVLGQLMDQPMTGYQLRKALKFIVGEEQTVSYGVLYPLLDKLKQQQLIKQNATANATRSQKQAEITAAGRQQFHDLVLEPVTINKQTQLTFQIKCRFLHLLTGDEQQRVLKDFQQFSQFQLANLEETQRYLTDSPRMVAEDVIDADRLNTLQLMRAQVQNDWIAEQLAQLTEEE